MKNSKEIFSENLRDLLIAKKKTQSGLAKFTDSTKATVSYWCNGIVMPRSDKLDKICTYLNCSLEDLTTDHTKVVTYAPEDIIAEELRSRPQLMALFIVAIKMTDSELDELIQRIKK